MSEHAFNVAVRLETVTCAGCGTTYAIPAYLYRRYNEEGETIRCPNTACPWGGMRRTESEMQKLRAQLDADRKRLDFEKNGRVAAEERARKAEASIDRLRKRAKNGVCPCCGRTFAVLARHMKTKHPEYGNT